MACVLLTRKISRRNHGDYLCTVDYYFILFKQLKDKSGKEVKEFPTSYRVTMARPIFPMSSKFMTSYDIEYVTSSPLYPQSNGKVENASKTTKNLLKKSKADGTDFYLTLLAWKNTPSEGLESSPAQKMSGRCTRTLIHTTCELLKLRSK